MHDWLVANLPWEYGTEPPTRSIDLDQVVAFGRAWQAKLAADRWVGITWPTELGGRGLGPTEHFVVTEEMARARAPELVGRIGINLVGPTLFAHGTPEQCSQWLPPSWGRTSCGASCSASPRRAAIWPRSPPGPSGPTADGWSHGHKVWTSYAQFADWGLCLARSDPDAPKRQQGMSCLAVDMHAPGSRSARSSRSPATPSSTRSSSTTSSCPTTSSSAQAGAGWTVANSTLTHERGVNPRQLGIHYQLLAGLLELADSRPGGFDSWDVRQRVAEAYIEVKLFQLNNWRTLTRLERGEPPGPEGSALKLYWSEMSKRLHETVLAVLGPAAPLWQGATDNPGDGMWQRSWLYYQASSIFAGTNEVQRTLVGERVLGLPRD